ncbi:TIGR01777 family oxidoreductase [Actinoplanes subglobosus]|uniref:TIGR01777 family oxidoreductase n=1 Tax=Actinoplanes subglobosus TaxID=1547892 RepID=A0ABV8J907_9ACTN
MKIVIAGGTGQVGAILVRALTADGHDVVVLTRSPRGERQVRWDGSSLGDWAAEVDGSDVVVNLAGRSVSCRYTRDNLEAMMNSRVDSARVIGDAIAAAARPPAVWLQMSTATIYAHRFDAPNDESGGLIGGDEPGVPGYWGYSVRIAKNWEAAQERAVTPHTRKVALRSAMVMSPDRGGVFDYLSWLARLGLGGPVAGGRQFVSWIHDHDFARAVRFLIERDDLTGAVNLAAPHPLPHRDFMRELRAAWRMPFGLPATRQMAEIGAFALRSDTELLLKSRRVVPGRLTDAGFTFDFPRWRTAAADLAARRRLPEQQPATRLRAGAGARQQLPEDEQHQQNADGHEEQHPPRHAVQAAPTTHDPSTSPEKVPRA